MSKRIDVPGVGIVEFPESMSDEQITNAIRNNIMPKYSAQMERPSQTFGRSAASLADTALNTLRGVADIPVRAVARAYYGGMKGVPLEQQEPLLQNVSNAILPQQDSFGKMFGVTGTPGYESAPLRQLGTYAGETIGQNVIQPLAEATGLPEGYVGDVVNLGTAAVAPAVPKVARTVTQPVRDVATGFRQGLAQPTYQRGAGSSFVPLQEKFYPSKQVDPFMKATPEQRVAMLPELEASQKPSSSLFTSTPGMLARNLAPKSSAGETLIPFRGETMRAFGEQMARDIGTNTLPTAGVSLGGALLGGLVGGVPGALIGGSIAPVARLSQLGTLGTLGRTARFSRGFPEALGEAQQMATRPQPMPGPVAPTPPAGLLPYNPTQPPIYVSPEGVAGQNINQVSQAGVMSRYPQMPTPQQMAIEKTQQIAQQTPRPVQQQAAQRVVRPVQPTPTQGRSSQTIRQELNAVDDQMTSLRDNALAEGVRPDSPESTAYLNQMNTMNTKFKALESELKQALELEKKQSRAAKKKGPSNVSQMLIDDKQLPTGISSLSKEAVGEIYPNKSAYDKAMLFKTLEENVPTASYIEGDKLITVYPQNIPKDLMKKAGINPMATIIRDVKTGKVIKD